MSTRAALVLRADADHRIGTGHVMRGLALGQAWQDRFSTVHVANACMPPSLVDRLEANGFVVHLMGIEPGSHKDAAATLEIARQVGAEWIAADGYVFGEDFQQAIHASDRRLLLVDDYGHQPKYCADLLLNQNLGAAETLYSEIAPHTRLLLGTPFAMLRRQFTERAMTDNDGLEAG